MKVKHFALLCYFIVITNNKIMSKYLCSFILTLFIVASCRAISIDTVLNNPFVQVSLINTLHEKGIAQAIITLYDLMCELKVDGTDDFCEDYNRFIKQELLDIEKLVSNNKISEAIVSSMKVICQIHGDEQCTEYVNSIEPKIYNIEKLLSKNDIGMASAVFIDIVCDIIPEDVKSICKEKVNLYMESQKNSQKCDL